MGWSSGTTLFEKIIKTTKTIVPDFAIRKALYIKYISAFEDADWDNLDECMGLDDAYDEAVRELYPSDFDE